VRSKIGQEDYLKMKSLKQLAVVAVMTAAVGMVTLVAVPRLRADGEHAKCQHQIERAESRLDQAIHKHGEGSSQAEERRRDLNAERERCWSAYHGWWDGHDKRWHDAHDWDQDHHDDHQ
jgi:hypothetical protein